MDGPATGAGRGGWRDEDAHQFTPASCDPDECSSDPCRPSSLISVRDGV
ncbi:MAG: hypothetical protein AVDCRST_MAG48-2967 [uncultured Friedmanniella sp.]|uniref:Uncharacterized protein n=1 Tax=uncultured Friedmanniella sp. TaxID=335381 RepID=A0A6J4L9C9_9ACTN|nr:MAG: hypothetical protein AVDCRST_MAG48-2967 [uncultured Friedmanniella sp.]